jgi:enoyl-CoA hydratase
MPIRLEGKGIATLYLDRPKVNALNGAMLAELGKVAAQIEADDAIQGVLIRSTGRCFSAGLDLAELLDADRATVEAFLTTFGTAFNGFFGCGKPIAAAVEGHAIAGGLVLALAADFVALQTGGYKLGLTELQVGVPFPDSALQVVIDAIPARAAKRLIYGAGLHSPSETYQMGVGDVLVDDASAAAEQWLQTVCARPLQTFRETKRRMRRGAQARIANGPGDAAVVEALLSAPVRAAIAQTLRR